VREMGPLSSRSNADRDRDLEDLARPVPSDGGACRHDAGVGGSTALQAGMRHAGIRSLGDESRGTGRSDTAHSRTNRAKGRTLVLGLGNPFLADDSVGLRVARKVRELLPLDAKVEVQDGSVAGFDLLDVLSGFQRAIVIDAIKTAGGNPGSIYRLTPEELPTSERLAAIHEINLSTALRLGRLMKMDMPDDVAIYAVEVEDARTFSETCCPAVAAAVDVVAGLVVSAVAGQAA
jgi:hydrogenase maturation protease